MTAFTVVVKLWTFSKDKKKPKTVNKFRRRTSLQSLARAKVNQLRDCVKRHTKGDLAIYLSYPSLSTTPRATLGASGVAVTRSTAPSPSQSQSPKSVIPWGAILVYSLCGIWSRAVSINGAVSGSAGTSIKSMKSKTATAQKLGVGGQGGRGERGSPGESFRRSADDFCGWPNVFIVTLFGYQKAKQKRKQKQKRKTEQNVNN